MQEARSSTTRQIVTAWDFSQLDPDVIAAQRGNFVCAECEGPAHFRKASRNGHDACFAARPHSPDCTLAVRGDGPWGPEGDEVVRRWEADRTRIILTLANDADIAGPGGDGAAREQRGGGRHVGGGEPLGTRIQRGPQRLLSLLISSDTFRTSTVEMVLPNGTTMPANQFFVTFDNANPQQHVGQYRGYWGKAVRVATWQKDGSKYINTSIGRDGDRLAMNVDADLIHPVCDRFRIDSIGGLVGKYVLFFGEPYVTAGRQFTLYVRNAAHMAVVEADAGAIA